MKLFKLVLTGTAILLCILLVILKRTREFAQTLHHAAGVVQQGNAEQDTATDSITDYPFNVLVPVHY